MEEIRINLKKCNIFEVLSHDRIERRNKTHVVDRNIRQCFDDDDVSFILCCITLLFSPHHFCPN